MLNTAADKPVAEMAPAIAGKWELPHDPHPPAKTGFVSQSEERLTEVCLTTNTNRLNLSLRKLSTRSCLEFRMQDDVVIWRFVIVTLKEWKSSNQNSIQKEI